MSITPGTIGQMLLEVGEEAYEHREQIKDVVEMAIDAITKKKVDPIKIRNLIEQEITRQADEEMRREFPEPPPVPNDDLPGWLPVSKP